MATTIPRKQNAKISELSIMVNGVRIIPNARILDLTDAYVTLRFKKPRSPKRWEQIFPMERVLFIKDKAPGTMEQAEIDELADEGEETGDEAETQVAGKPPKRFCNAIVLDTYQIDEFADIASIDKLVGTKVFATTVEGYKIVADTSICKLVQDVHSSAKAPEIVGNAVAAAAGPATALSPTLEKEPEPAKTEESVKATKSTRAPAKKADERPAVREPSFS